MNSCSFTWDDLLSLPCISNICVSSVSVLFRCLCLLGRQIGFIDSALENFRRKHNIFAFKASVSSFSLVKVSSCNNTRSIRDDPYWTSRKTSLELIELSSIN